MTYPEFLAYFAPLSIILVALAAYRWRATGAFRPYDANILSWECMLFLFARWPWALAGTLALCATGSPGSFVDFRVTPKDHPESIRCPCACSRPTFSWRFSAALRSCSSKMPKAKGFYLFASSMRQFTACFC